MKLLLDENLPRSLLVAMPSQFAGSTHVADVGLDAILDRAIYEYEGAHGFTIVSKDCDFRQLRFLLGAPPRSFGFALATPPFGR